MTILRSALFVVWFAVVTLVLAVGFLPALVLPRGATRLMAKLWCGGLIWGLRVFARLHLEIRGPVPRDGALVAAKHMTMLDTILLYATLNDAVFVIKRELLRIPFYGWYAKSVEMIGIDREGGAGALRKMVAAAKNALGEGRALIVYPEGTRRKAGAPPAYKPGIAGIYGQLGVACVPVALNAGLFWTGPVGFLKKKGTVVLEFLPAIPPGLPRADFMRELEDRIETATTELLAEGRAQLARG